MNRFIEGEGIIARTTLAKSRGAALAISRGSSAQRDTPGYVREFSKCAAAVMGRMQNAEVRMKN
jgi:hypothetical protein